MDKRLCNTLYVMFIIFMFWFGVLCNRQYIRFVEKIQTEAIKDFILKDSQFVNPRNFNYEQEKK